MTATKPLSGAQLYELRQAIQDGGKLRKYGISIRTIQILTEAGLIARMYEILDELIRSEMQATIDKYVLNARQEMRERADWQAAWRWLKRAMDTQTALDATAYWITDEGRRAVQP